MMPRGRYRPFLNIGLPQVWGFDLVSFEPSGGRPGTVFCDFCGIAKQPIQFQKRIRGCRDFFNPLRLMEMASQRSSRITLLPSACTLPFAAFMKLCGPRPKSFLNFSGSHHDLPNVCSGDPKRKLVRSNGMSVRPSTADMRLSTEYHALRLGNI